MLACGHGSFEGFAGVDVDYGVEEVGFAVLAAEVLEMLERWREREGDGRGVGAC